MNDDAVFHAFEEASRLVSAYLVAHWCTSFPRRRAVVDVAQALLADARAAIDPEAVAWPILREHTRQTIDRLRTHAELKVRAC